MILAGANGMCAALALESAVREIQASGSEDHLTAILRDLTHCLGFDYFALTQHSTGPTGEAVRLHSYPADWVEHYDQYALAGADPIRRASRLGCHAFYWSELSNMMCLTDDENETLRLGRAAGLIDGVTIPANVPGEPAGSCSFAKSNGATIDHGRLAELQLLGLFAFDRARRLGTGQVERAGGPRHLTDRQRDCVLWVARGKTDWEIGKILGVCEETVAQHLKQARERFEVSKRTSLVVEAILRGEISPGEIQDP
ncbi:LuxR family transcriptional regulator [Sphingomonas psychrotolerans]|uniref:LuxR family transcriptional regulator n=2 Tax=Sphingomonas psychrotolerans TaxID=1327635 RepID=A0A2K8MKA4_9SPHN|nr:LuxR family transcriptional regulator [Sphingomonas psychrotolerans]